MRYLLERIDLKSIDEGFKHKSHPDHSRWLLYLGISTIHESQATALNIWDKKGLQGYNICVCKSMLYQDFASPILF